METDDNEVDVATVSNDLNGLVSTLEEWIPEFDDELKPMVGKVLNTLEEGGNFYKRYAHVTGFSVHNSFETKDKDGIRWKYFLCSKEGFKVEKKIIQAKSLVDEKNLPKTRR